MCKPFNGKMKEFKWRPGIFNRRLQELHMHSRLHAVLRTDGILRDERYYRSFKRLVLFADLEDFKIQPPCHWNYKLADDKIKIALMNMACPCGINTDEIHYMDMNDFEMNEEGKIMFTKDHDVDFGFGGFYDFEMWSDAEEEKIEKLVEKLKRSDEKTRRSVKSNIVKFIDKTMTALEQNVLRFEFYMALTSQLAMTEEEAISRRNSRNAYNEKRMAEIRAMKPPKRSKTPRQKRLEADAIQAVKDAEEARMKQLAKKKSESTTSNGKKKKKSAKTHNFFRKSQKPTKL